MTTRITQKQLENAIARLNRNTGQIPEPYTRDEEGNFKANVGTYTLDQAYGGSRLVRIANEHGAITVISNSGFTTKRNLYNEVQTLNTALENRESWKQ